MAYIWAFIYAQILLIVSYGLTLGTFVNMVPECDISKTANSTVTFKCPLSSAPNSVVWMKNDQKIETNTSFTVHNENGSLSLTKIGEMSSGDFTCIVGNMSSVVTVCALPYVRQYDRPKNVIEGDRFQTECHAWGYPAVTVIWHFGSEPVVAEASRVILRNGSVENSTLRVEDVHYEDSADYTCVVTNALGSVNATVSLRVKDKYAALWPFLGVCAEVVILCIIIFLYERRQAKQLEKETEKEETDFMTANNDVKDELKHRK